ncbi:lipocalin family protein [Pelagicoccus sp. SDUM812005]|uniref:lipocalin family protein n=1 Tax=Pelagicoccus sp. SDUM812005 TaxID=3041257 RepID=UPI00280FF711|nr:lipocalin family protein [Pelagicoccus sp. SDUM812005]MDQ8182699.1 lipocalin family protein [Pelagicoccus sp. SDUM812005]
MKWILILGLVAFAGVLLLACRKSGGERPNQVLAEYVDLERFMGTWYVHGYTPTPLDKNAYNATETYELEEDGKIQTTYRFQKGGFDGKWKTMKPRGWVHDTVSNAEWRMRFFGVFTAPYYILYVSPDYKETVIGHPDKDLAWVMTRSAQLGDRDYERLLLELARRDYDLSKVERVSHSEL